MPNARDFALFALAAYGCGVLGAALRDAFRWLRRQYYRWRLGRTVYDGIRARRILVEFQPSSEPECLSADDINAILRRPTVEHPDNR